MCHWNLMEFLSFVIVPDDKSDRPRYFSIDFSSIRWGFQKGLIGIT
jgi:hypothetical protein